MVKNLPANAGDTEDVGLIPGSGTSPGDKNDNPFQYSCLGNPMDRGAPRAIVHGVTKSWTQLNDSVQFSSVQSLSRVQLFATPWIAARQASLSITNSQSSLRLMSIESVMPSSHLILCHPLLLMPPIRPSIRVFSNESRFAWGGQSPGVSALASFLPKKS